MVEKTTVGLLGKCIGAIGIRSPFRPKVGINHQVQITTIPKFYNLATLVQPKSVAKFARSHRDKNHTQQTPSLIDYL